MPKYYDLSKDIIFEFLNSEGILRPCDSTLFYKYYNEMEIVINKRNLSIVIIGSLFLRDYSIIVFHVNSNNKNSEYISDSLGTIDIIDNNEMFYISSFSRLVFPFAYIKILPPIHEEIINIKINITDIPGHLLDIQNSTEIERHQKEWRSINDNEFKFLIDLNNTKKECFEIKKITANKANFEGKFLWISKIFIYPQGIAFIVNKNSELLDKLIYGIPYQYKNGCDTELLSLYLLVLFDKNTNKEYHPLFARNHILKNNNLIYFEIDDLKNFQMESYQDYLNCLRLKTKNVQIPKKLFLNWLTFSPMS